MVRWWSMLHLGVEHDAQGVAVTVSVHAEQKVRVEADHGACGGNCIDVVGLAGAAP